MFSIYFDKKIEAIEKKLAKLEKNSHPKRKFVTCEYCKKKIKEM